MRARNEATAWREIAAAYGAGAPSVALGDAIAYAPFPAPLRMVMEARMLVHEALLTIPMDNDARCLACLLLAIEAES